MRRETGNVPCLGGSRSQPVSRGSQRGFLPLGSVRPPGIAYGTEMTVVGLLTEAAAPALQAAAPSNDPALAGQELLEPQSGQRFHADAATRPSLARTRALRPQLRSGVPAALFAGSRPSPCSRAPITTARSTCRAASSTTPQARPAAISGSNTAAAGTSRTSPWASRAGSRTSESRNSSATVSARSSVYARCRCARTCTTMFPRARPVGRSPSDGWMATIWKSVPRSRSCPGPGCGPTASGRSTWTARPSARTIASACG